ncbi:MAG TPA: hypothetical protein VI541_01505, partial [Actinomycetota bacterium]|nr:hypothetical protein [Actinomycetota bacterium]
MAPLTAGHADASLAPLLSRASFTTGFDGWAAVGEAQTSRILDAADPVLEIHAGSALSAALPEGVSKLQLSYRDLDPYCCSATKLVELRDSSGSPLLTLEQYSSTLVVTGASVQYVGHHADTGWHRLTLDLSLESIAIRFDDILWASAAPASSNSLGRVAAATGQGRRLLLDDVMAFGPGAVRSDSFYYTIPDGEFQFVDSGPYGRTERQSGASAARDVGYARVIGGPSPGEVHNVTWP